MIFLPLETELFYYEHLLDSSDNLQLIRVNVKCCGLRFESA